MGSARLHRGEATLRDARAALRDGTRAHYQDPSYYDKAYHKRAEDVRFYVERARRSGGPVLEYGVGNGRIAIPMAEAGLEVTGVDLSRAMLAALRADLRDREPALQRRIHAVRGDMRRTRLGRVFPLVIAPFNVILHLYERADVEAFLARVHEHLTARGRFVFDFSVPRPADLVFEPNRRYGAPRFRHPDTGLMTRYSERFEYDILKQLLLISMEFRPERGPVTTTPLTHRQFFPREMEALLHYNGFSVVRWTADFTEREPDQEVDSLVVECRRRAGFPQKNRPNAPRRRRRTAA